MKLLLLLGGFVYKRVTLLSDRDDKQYTDIACAYQGSTIITSAEYISRFYIE